MQTREEWKARIEDLFNPVMASHKVEYMEYLAADLMLDLAVYRTDDIFGTPAFTSALKARSQQLKNTRMASGD